MVTPPPERGALRPFLATTHEVQSMAVTIQDLWRIGLVEEAICMPQAIRVRRGSAELPTSCCDQSSLLGRRIQVMDSANCCGHTCRAAALGHCGLNYPLSGSSNLNSSLSSIDTRIRKHACDGNSALAGKLRNTEWPWSLTGSSRDMSVSFCGSKKCRRPIP